MRNIYFLLGFIWLIFSCNHKSNRPSKIEHAFYYWKNTGIDQDNVSQLKKLNVQKLYVKLFEVDYSDVKGNFPFSKNQPGSYDFKNLDSIDVVPCVFIKNGIFQYNDDKMLDQLADNIVYLINKYSVDVDYNGVKTPIFTYNEIQIDCDWTASTKDKYFYLLKKIKSLSKKNLSCTLRLYPYKYSDKMGVPPVDKAMLMCYNLIKPLTNQDKNSILDNAELKKYFNERIDYPLHLDVALPTFYWTQLYQNNHFVQLLDLCSKEVKSFATVVKPFWYRIERDTSINYELYLKAGDQLKCEEVSVKEINEAIDVLKSHVRFDDETTVSLFDLDRSTFKTYTHEEIDGFYNRFRN